MGQATASRIVTALIKTTVVGGQKVFEYYFGSSPFHRQRIWKGILYHFSYFWIKYRFTVLSSFSDGSRLCGKIEFVLITPPTESMDPSEPIDLDIPPESSTFVAQKLIASTPTIGQSFR